MHHKRGRPKNRRSGCLMCKPQKQNGWGALKNPETSNEKKEVLALIDIKNALMM